MSQEEKELLLKDLCGRLPYHPQIYVYVEDIGGSCEFNEPLWTIEIDTESYLVNDRHISEDIKPYLRPMSSMTKEEEDDLRILKNRLVECNEDDDEKFYGIIGDIHNFYYSRHIDCNSLIDRGLALEAPEGIYKNE